MTRQKLEDRRGKTEKDLQLMTTYDTIKEHNYYTQPLFMNVARLSLKVLMLVHRPSQLVASHSWMSVLGGSLESKGNLPTTRG